MSVRSSVVRTLFARLRVGVTFAIAGISALAKPAMYLWPWVLGVFVFAAFLGLPQATALAEQYHGDAIRPWEVAGTVTASWVAVGLACLLALTAPALRRTERLPKDRSDQVGYAIDTVAGGAWIVSLASAHGVLVAKSVGLVAAWAAVTTLAIVGALAVSVAARSARDQRSAVWRFHGVIQRHHVFAVATASMLALGPMILGAFASVVNPLRLSETGPLLVGMIGISSVSTLLGIVVVVVPLYLRRPWIGVAFVVTMAAWTTGHRPLVDLDNPLLRDFRKSMPSAPSTLALPGYCGETASTLQESLRRHAEDTQPSMSATESGRHMYLVSAEGGGIRAAYWTAITLAHLDIATRGSFGKEVASLSGVSGGSLGIATWLAARDREDLDAQGRLRLITEFLGSDFLSPALGGLLFLDVPRLLMGPLWPEARRDHVFEKALADRWRDVARSDYFARPMLDGCGYGFRSAPAVFFNATDALTGGYVPLTGTLLPFKLPRWNEPPDPRGPRRISWRDPQSLHNTSLARATWAQMVSISARFPYIAPEAHVGIDATVLADDRAHAELERQGTEVSKEWLEHQLETIGARLANLDAERLWSRVWVLVDGGYFDNSALTPTLHAIDIIDAERTKEGKGGPNASKPFTATTVHVVHISNDPGDPCLPMPEGWREQLSSHAREFLDKTGQNVDCKGDLARLEDSMQQSWLYPFVTPIETLLSVRSEHSSEMVAELEARVTRGSSPSGYTLEMRDLATAFADAYGTRRKLWGHSEEEMRASSLERLKRAEEHAEWARAEASRRVGRPATQEAVDAYLVALAEWQELVSSESGDVDCHIRFKPPVGPPLGWTLSKSNQELMRCLSLRDRTVAGFWGRVLEPPYLPWTGEYTTNEARFRSLWEAERTLR